MATALTVYANNAASSTLSSANTLVSSSGTISQTSQTTAIGASPSTNTYGEVTSQGTASTWPNLSSAPSPSGNGWLFDVTTLEAQQFIAGSWSGNIKLRCTGGGSVTGNIIVRAYIRSSGGTYTSIGSITLTGQSITSSSGTFTLSATSFAQSAAFSTGDKLYFDVIVKITATSGLGSSSAFSIYQSNTANIGSTAILNLATAGYQASGIAQTGACTVSGQGTLSLTAELDAVGSITATGQGILSASGMLAAAGGVTAVGQGALIILSSVQGQVTLGGAGAMSASGVVGLLGSLTASGQGVLSAFGQVLMRARGTFTVTITGQAVNIEAGTLTIQNAIGQRSTADFVVTDTTGSLHFDEGQSVTIVDYLSTLLFFGYVASSTETKPGYGAVLQHRIQCMDAGYLADKRIAAKAYTNQTAGAIVNDLLSTYLAPEGVVAGTIQDGPTIVAASFNYVPVSDCLKHLAEKSGFWWDIDQNKQLQFQVSGTVAAPFSVSSSADILASTASVDRTTPLYRNRQWIRGVHAITSPQTETRKGDGTTRAFTFSYPMNQAPTACTVNGSAKTLGIKGIDSGRDFYWSKGDPIISQDAGGTLLATTDTLSVTYVGQYTAIVQSDDLAAQTARAALEGGTTGIVENVEDGPQMNSTDEAFQAANAKLQRFTAYGQGIQFDLINRPGLMPGQLLTVNAPEHALVNAGMLIETVTITDDDPNLRYTVKALYGPFNTSWVQFFANLAQKPSLVDNLSLGAAGTITILQTITESWSWAETVTESVYACPICNTTLKCGTGVIVC